MRRQATALPGPLAGGMRTGPAVRMATHAPACVRSSSSSLRPQRCNSWPCRRVAVYATAAARSQPAVEQAPKQEELGSEPGAAAGLGAGEFKYTMVAIRTGSARRPSKKAERPAATSTQRNGSTRSSKDEQPYRAFESMEGCALPLMMLGAEQLSHPDGLAPQPHAPPAATSSSSSSTRTHRRAAAAAPDPPQQAALPGPTAIHAVLWPPAEALPTHLQQEHQQQGRVQTAAAIMEGQTPQEHKHHQRQRHQRVAAAAGVAPSNSSLQPQHLQQHLHVAAAAAAPSQQHLQGTAAPTAALPADSPHRQQQPQQQQHHGLAAPAAFTSPSAAQAHIFRCGRVLGLPPFSLAKHMELQLELLKIPSPRACKQQVQALGLALRLPAATVRDMVQAHPPLLTADVAVVQLRALQLAALLHLDGCGGAGSGGGGVESDGSDAGALDGSDLVQQHQHPHGPSAQQEHQHQGSAVAPSSAPSTSTTTAPTPQLHSLLQRHPALLTAPLPPHQALTTLARALSGLLPMQALAPLVLANPNLLAQDANQLRTGGTVAGVASCLLEELGGPSAQGVVAGVLAALPELLGRCPAALRGCCVALSVQWGLPAAQLAEVVEAQPQLLLLSPRLAQVASERVKRLLLNSRHWYRDVPRLAEKPRVLAKVLRFSTARVDRLDYLVSTLRDGGLHWKDALTMPDADWHEMYPAYKDWWAKRGR